MRSNTPTYVIYFGAFISVGQPIDFTQKNLSSVVGLLVIIQWVNPLKSKKLM